MRRVAVIALGVAAAPYAEKLVPELAVRLGEDRIVVGRWAPGDVVLVVLGPNNVPSPDPDVEKAVASGEDVIAVRVVAHGFAPRMTDATWHLHEHYWRRDVDSIVRR